MVALAALLMLGAAWVFFEVIRRVLGHVWLVGSSIAGIIESGLLSAMKSIANDLDGLQHGIAHWLWSTAVGIWHLVYQLTNAIADAKQWAVNAYFQATGALASAEAYAAAQANAVASQLGSDVAALDRDITNAIGSAEAFTSASVAAAIAGVNTAIADVENAAVRDLAAAEAFTSSQVAAAIAAAQTAASDVQNWAVQQLAGVEGTITSLEAQVAAIPAELQGVIGQTIPGDIASALAAAGVASIPGLLSQVAALTTEADTCLQPLCDTVTPNAPKLGNLGKFLSGLEALGIEAAILALAAEAVTDPTAVVNDIDTVVKTVGQPLVTVARELVNL